MPSPVDPGREDRMRRRVAVGAGGFAVVALAGVAASMFLGGGDDGPTHPDEWDPRVVELVEFVEDERELRFDHPVHIDFLTPEEYSEAARSDPTDLTDEERAELDDLASTFRSLGLLSGEIDLFEAMNDLSDSGTLAYYDPATDRITVRGTELTVDVRVTLVHELVHALQDQHFDLDRLQEIEDSGAVAAFRGIVEGDASLVDSSYVEQLPRDERDEYDATTLEQVEEAGFDEIPGILTASFGAQYALGEPLVGIVQSLEGWDGVDDLLRDPPTTELELVHVLAHLDGFTEVDVDVPEVPDGNDVVDEGDFGAITLFLMLAARMDPVEALAVTDEWRGDAYVTTRDPDGRICTDIVVAAGDADRVEDAFEAWVDAGPVESDASVTRTGDRTRLRSCDPGADVDVELATDPLDAMAVPATRSYLVLNVVMVGLEPEVGVCVADGVLAAIPLEVLSDPDPDPDVITDLQATMSEAMGKCAARAA